MSHLDQLQHWLRINRLQGMLIPSTDAFLSEFTAPAQQRLRWVTGFSGSVGVAVALHSRTALFVDGRYMLQAQAETSHSALEVVRSDEAAREDWLCKHLKPGDRLALDPTVHSFPEGERLRVFTQEIGVDLVMLSDNPIDHLWREDRPPFRLSRVQDHPVNYAGRSSPEKVNDVRHWLVQHRLGGYLVADPEDVAWLLNVRAQDWPFAPVCLSRAFIDAAGPLIWFVDAERLAPDLLQRLDATIEIAAPKELDVRLTDCVRGKAIAANLRRTPFNLASIVVAAGRIRNSAIIEQWRWKKHPREIESARQAHYLDGLAVIRFLAWLERTVPKRTVTELDAAAQLRAFREAIPEYRGPSMPAMSASGPNGALPHYVPSCESNRVLNEHPIYWIDSGGQYVGASTDNTVAVAIGQPEPKHKVAHTLVLKGFIALATVRFPCGTLASQLDSFARQYLWKSGMDYPHGTGHGVGSYLNIHEGPVIGKFHIHTPLNVPIEAGMIVSNEPAYYAESDFGVRIESHVLAVKSTCEGFLEFETLSHLPIDDRLVEASLLTAEERRWLATYQRGVQALYAGQLDEPTAEWLNARVAPFVHG